MFLLTPLIIFSFNSCKNISNNHLAWDQILDFKIESPYKENKNWFLPFLCGDLNLLNRNSATFRTIIKSEININENEITFYLKYREYLYYKPNKINNIKLGKLNPGTYTLYYVSENKKKYLLITL